jgi:exosortase
MAPLAFAWLAAAEAHIMEGRQLAAMTLFELFLLAILGISVWRVIAFALVYLYFLVPAGAFITPALQDFAARFAVRGLEVPGARFTVAEACAGLRFLIASVALGTLYGYMMYRDWGRRAAFIVVSIVVPIIANGFRVLGIVILGYWLGDAKAAIADHLIYGWVFFSMVSLILILLGLPFRQATTSFDETPRPAPRESPAARLRMAGAAIGAMVLVCLLTSAWVTDGPIGSTMARALGGIKHSSGL